MAETTITTSITELREKLDEVQLDRGLAEMKADLASMERLLEMIKAKLRDAEKKELRDETMKVWLDNLWNLAYEADDLFDSYYYYNKLVATGRHLRNDDDDDTKVRDTLTSLETEIYDDLKRIKKQFDGIAKNRKDLLLTEQIAMESPFDDEALRWLNQKTGSLPADRHRFFGREQDLFKLVNLLRPDTFDASTDRISALSSGDLVDVPVIALVGMWGVGKTTLAQHAYQSPEVNGYFDVKGWVSVEMNFDLIKHTEAAYQSLANRPSGFTELSPIQEALRSTVQGKKLLLVMDGVWDVDSGLWDNFLTPLKSGARGSKILLTTRNAQVAKGMREVQQIELGCLSDEDGWELLESCAFKGPNDPRRSIADLEDIGKKIVRKCGGLPSAIKILARSLRNEPENGGDAAGYVANWKQVLDADHLDSSDPNGKQIVGPLKLSYLHLPLHLKPCFRYWALFPKNHYVNREEVVLLLMAHGLVHGAGGEQTLEKTLEKIGNEYIEELSSRSFFKAKETDVVMHSIIHELAQKISGDEFQRIVGDDCCPLSGKVRHLAICSNSEKLIESESLNDRAIRSLLVLMRSSTGKSGKDLKRIAVKFKNEKQLKRLRALYLSGSNMVELPSYVRHLRHLRYLKLRDTKINNLPEWICSLYNLRALDLGFALNLEELPRSIGNLRHLRYLNLRGTKIETFPESIRNLQELQRLDVSSPKPKLLLDLLVDEIQIVVHAFPDKTPEPINGHRAVESVAPQPLAIEI